MKIAKNVVETIGRTPLVELSARTNPGPGRVVAKLEYFNPGGSSKDRSAAGMIAEAEADGRLKPGATIIEPTSGNAGVGLALVSAVKGYHLVLVMPETMSIERRRLAGAYGAEIVLTPGAEGMKGSIARAHQLHEERPGSVMFEQFESMANPAAHEASTGPEVWNDTDGTVDAFVAGVGTGGTITGAGHYLKARKPGVHIVAVEPDTSAVLSGKPAGPHKLQGIGVGFIPKTLDTTVYDEVIAVSDEDAARTARDLAAHEGILVGIAAGAAAFGALELAKRPEWAGKTIVVLLADTGERYLSTGLFD